jgi:2-dehydro-3-deoxyphosphogalactonate aldolase
MTSRFTEAMAKLPLVAILRGITPAEAPDILRALIGEGFLLIEAPLNSPQPYESIRAMRAIAPPEALVGAGTVKTAEEVAAVAEAGGDLIVMPHADVEIIAAAKARGLIALPGVATPTEAFAALKAGADGLKAPDRQSVAGGHPRQRRHSPRRRRDARQYGALSGRRRQRLWAWVGAVPTGG